MSIKRKIAAILLWGAGAAGFMTLVTVMGVTTSVATTACDAVDGSDDGAAAEGSAATGSSSGIATSPTQARSIDTKTLCSRLVTECGQPTTIGDCTKTYGSYLVSSQCNTLLADTTNTTCADLIDTSSTVTTTCFPPCASPDDTCNADGSLTQCSSAGNTTVSSCQLSCIALGTQYTGTCGTTYMDQVSASAQCWCQ